jgi:hypothetical protein
MKIRSLILGGVASVSLIGVMAIATPSFAQNDPNPPQVSTPAERSQTQQLNQQGQDGSVQSPAVLNGQPDTGAPSATQAQYNDQQQQYQQQQQQYQNQQAQYQDQRAHYIHDLHRYDVVKYEWTDYPHAYAYRYRDSDLVHVDTLDRRQLAYVPIEGPDGRWVGRIRSVEYTPDGHVGGRVEIALNRHVSVYVNATDLVYDARNHVIFTDLTRDQLWAMPGEEAVTEIDHP